MNHYKVENLKAGETFLPSSDEALVELEQEFVCSLSGFCILYIVSFLYHSPFFTLRKWVSSFRNSFFFIDSNRLHRMLVNIVWMRIVMTTSENCDENRKFCTKYLTVVKNYI